MCARAQTSLLAIPLVNLFVPFRKLRCDVYDGGVGGGVSVCVHMWRSEDAVLS